MNRESYRIRATRPRAGRRTRPALPTASRVLLLALLLPALTLAPVPSARGENRPLPPRDAWARDRPDDGGQKVDLGWSESPSPGIASYRVYRSESPGGPFRLVGVRSTDAFVNYLGYVDTGLTDGVTYYYRVTAVNRQGRESEPTPVLSAVPEAQVFQAAVTIRKSMVVSLAEQRLYCLENGRVVYVFLVSTGTASKPTPTGNFRILYHDYVHPIPKYPGTVCYYWMGFYEDYAIHAWPVYNGVQGDYSSLGRPASNGCVRLDPRLAHIPYYWAPDGTPLSIIPGRFQPPPPPVRGGHVAASVDSPSQEWYFAEGFTGAGFDEYILILNPGEEAARVELDFMLPDGRVEGREYLASPHSRLTVGVDSIPGLENTEVSARVTSDRPVVAERAMYFDYLGRTGGHAAVGSPSPSTQWYFAEGFTGAGFDEYILILNPGEEAARVELDFMLPDGRVEGREYLASPHSRLTVGVDSIPGLENTEVSARVTSDRPVVAERAMYFGYPSGDDGHACTGVSEASTQWYFAEGFTGAGFDEYILILNPGEEAARVELDFMLPDGRVEGREYLASPHSRLTVGVDSIPGLENTEVSARVTSDRPVVAERAMYFGYPECPGGHAETGRTQASSRHFLAEGYTSPFFETYLLFQNPGDSAVTADVSFLKPDGTEIREEIALGPRSRGTLKVNQIPGLEGTEFSVVVTADGPILVERSTYFNYPR